MSFKQEFHDRGMKKWGGFYLSEHSATQEKQAQNEKNKPLQKPQLETAAIEQLLNTAIVKQLEVAIQIEQVDMDGNYSPDTVGPISGSDEQGLYIGSTKILFDEIRHVELLTQKKWSTLKDD